MSKKEKNIIARRLAHSYLLSIVSISMVLLLVGIFGMIAVNAGRVSDYFKEHVKVSAILKENVAEEEALALNAQIQKNPAVKTTKYISKEQGTLEMKEMLGPDFLSAFESNPIPISIEIGMNADYVSAGKMQELIQVLTAFPQVDEVTYQASLVEMLNKNMEKIGLTLLVFVILLLLVSFVLINNTVRLNVYSKRFSIYTMRLVGATKSFIRAPFLIKALFQGLIAGLLASAFLTGLLYWMRNEYGQLFSLFHMESIVIVLGGIVLLGMVICIVCTFFVVSRLVTLHNDELYY